MPEPVTRVGNLTGDPELRFTSNGKAVCDFSLAYEPYNYETKTRGETVFYTVTAWEQMAENVAETLQKGDRVIVQGIPKTEEYPKNDGTKGTRKVITAIAVGPELRFATASVTKNARKNAPAPSSDPWANGGDEPPF